MVCDIGVSELFVAPPPVGKGDLWLLLSRE